MQCRIRRMKRLRQLVVGLCGAWDSDRPSSVLGFSLRTPNRGDRRLYRYRCRHAVAGSLAGMAWHRRAVATLATMVLCRSWSCRCVNGVWVWCPTSATRMPEITVAEINSVLMMRSMRRSQAIPGNGMASCHAMHEWMDGQIDGE